MNKPLSEDELQRIEHLNKMLLEHQEIVNKVVNETEQLLNNYVPIISTYVQSIGKVAHLFGEHVTNIIKSSRQLGIVTGTVQDVSNFIASAEKLDKILTPELIEKLRKISHE